MSKRIFPVSIDLSGTLKQYSVEFQRDARFQDLWKRVLLQAHSRALVTCLCDGRGEKRLSVRHQSRSDKFYLARFPFTGHEHDPECVYYAPDPSLSGLAGYRPGVVEDMEDGGVKVKLAVSLQKKDLTSTKKKVQQPSSRQKQPGKPSMTLLGLLHLLWTTARFNLWRPAMQGKRHPGVIHHYLLDAAKSIQAGRVRLSQVLAVWTGTSTSDQAKGNAQRTKNAAMRQQRMIVVAPLASYREEYEGAMERPPIKGFYGFPRLHSTPALWEDVCRRFPREFIAWRQGETIVAILQCDAPMGSPYEAEVFDMALMQVTPDWIPVDSFYEAQLVRHLIEQQRSFEKPLRFDSSNEAVFPDFWLLDRHERIPLEVFGMNTPEYVARKAEKERYYTERYGADGWWSWNAQSGSEIPRLP